MIDITFSSFFSSLGLTLVYILLILGIPTLMVLGLTFINRDTKKMLADTFGYYSQIYIGCLGIIAHECSHALAALIFGHHIVAFKPFILPSHVGADGTLGYVRETHNPYSKWQSFGTLFVGTAPVWGCTALVILILKYMLPNLYFALMNSESYWTTNNWRGLLAQFSPSILFQNFSLRGVAFTIIGLALLISITVGGFDLSNADLHNGKAAFIATFIIVFVVLMVMGLFDLDYLVNYWLPKILTAFVGTMSISLVLSILVNFGCRIIRFLLF